MKRNQFLGEMVVVFSLAIALAMGLGFNDFGASIPLSVIVWPAIGLLVGPIIIFGSTLEESPDLSIDRLPELLKDDIEALRMGRITTEHLYVAASGAAWIAQLFLLGYYQKWMATWGPINVLMAGLVVVFVAGWVMLCSDWFQDRHRRSRQRIYVIPAVGWLICISLGVYWAEPIEFGKLSPLERSQLVRSAEYWSSTRASDAFYLFDFVSADGISCDDEICLIVVVVLCILGSIFIPHFWVVGTLVLLTIMTLITIRELLYLEG